MLAFLPRFLILPLALFSFTLNLTLCGIVVTLCGLVKLLRIKPLQPMISRVAHWGYRQWLLRNRQLINLFNRVEWQVSGDLAGLSQQQWYLLIANHKSWLDIAVLGQFALERIPEPKFFLKEELKYVPFIGSGSWALDMPFMKRYSQAQIRKNPALKGQDIETTRRSCEVFRTMPTTMINFVEGTRFTAAKHRAKNSPFTHLLPPKAGGIAFTLASMGELFDAVLDVTIVYPDNPQHVLPAMLTGRLRRVVIEVQRLPVDDSIIGDYFADDCFRHNFQLWLNERWLQKDLLINSCLQSAAPPTLASTQVQDQTS
jgi:1-acyl-sn-glycerol-3-phosphate acyltransferase